MGDEMEENTEDTRPRTLDTAPAIDPRELNDLLDFAAKGGLGQGVATQDCVAESPDQLMYIAGDTLVLLRDMGPIALASCEGVVGWINKDSIDFGTNPTATTTTTPPTTPTATDVKEFPSRGVTPGGLVVPDTIVSSPTPPSKTVSLPSVSIQSSDAYVVNDDEDPSPSPSAGLGVDYGTGSMSGSDGSPRSVGKRASGPFDLGTPQYSPDILQAERSFFEEQQRLHDQDIERQTREELGGGIGDGDEEGNDSEREHGHGHGESQTRVRASVMSTASSEAFGGIGGFMMGHVGNGSMDASGIEALRDHSPPAKSASTSTTISRSESGDTEVLAGPSTNQHPESGSGSGSYTSPSQSQQQESVPLQGSTSSPISPGSSKGRPESSDSWDIYGDYARDSMYYKRSTRDIRAMSGMDQAFNLAKALSEIPSPPPSSTRTTFSQKSTSTATTTGTDGTTKSISTAPGPPVDQDAMSPRSRSRPRPLPLDLHTAPRSLGLDDDQAQSPSQSQSQSPSMSRFDENSEMRSPIEGMGGQSIATELRLRIQRDRERERGTSSSSAGDQIRGRRDVSQLNGALAAPILPPRSSSRLTAAIASSDPPTPTPRAISPPTFLVTDAEESDEDRRTPRPKDQALDQVQAEAQSQSQSQVRESGIWEVGHDSGPTETSPSDLADSEQSTIIETPIGPNDGEQEVITTSPVDHDISSNQNTSVEKEVTSKGSPPLLASPIPLQGSQTTSSESITGSKRPTPQLSISPDPGTPYSRLNGGGLSPGPMSPSSRGGLSPDMASLPGSPFSPGSPASPHSVTATRQAAAEITRSAAAAAAGASGPGSGAVSGAGRITTLLGRTEDLLGSRGPVPITFHMGSPGGFRSTGPTMSPASSSMAKEVTHGLGLGLPSSSSSTKGRISPAGSASGHGPLGLNEFRRATSPLIGTAMIEHPSTNDADSRFPRNAIPSRNMSSPAQTYSTPQIPSRAASPDHASASTSVPAVPASVPTTQPATTAASQSTKKKSEDPGTTTGSGTGIGLFPRARSRSFGATVAKAMGRGKKEKDKERPPPPPAINTALSPKSANVVPLPSSTSAGGVSTTAPGSYRPAPAPAPASAPRKGSSSSDSRPIRSGPDRGSSSSSSSPKAPRRPSSPAMPPSPLGSFVNGGSPRIPTVPLSKTLTSDSAASSRSATSPGFPSPTLTTDSHSAAGSKTPRKASKTLATPSFPARGNGSGGNGNATPTSLASPVSHRDYAEETVKADGLDFELIQPRKPSSSGQHLSPGSPVTGSSGRLPSESYPSPTRINGSGDGDEDTEGPGMKRSETFKSDVSGASGRSIPLAETDEWGFIKDQSPTPEMYQSRSTASDHRSAETKWLGMISTPLPVGSGVPKKVRKLALESGIPASLRGKVWAWMLASNGSTRTPGLYSELISRETEGVLDEKTEHAIQTVYQDHSAFAGPHSTGTSDLRQILIAHSIHSSTIPTPTLALIAGMLLIHCVAEDAFWLLDGLAGSRGLLRGYITTTANSRRDHAGAGDNGDGKRAGSDLGLDIEVDSAVFIGLLAGSEKQMSKRFKEMGLHPRSFLEKWYSQLFIRCLPWPTALRVIDTLIAEGPRFLLITSLSILTLSRDRIMDLPSKSDILGYLGDLPQDALLLPEHFIKACSEVRFREEDYRKLRSGVQKEMGL